MQPLLGSVALLLSGLGARNGPGGCRLAVWSPRRRKIGALHWNKWLLRRPSWGSRLLAVLGGGLAMRRAAAVASIAVVAASIVVAVVLTILR